MAEKIKHPNALATRSQSNDALNFELAKNRITLEQTLFFIKAAATTLPNREEDSSLLGRLGEIAVSQLDDLMEMATPGSVLESELKSNTEGIKAIRRLIAKAVVTKYGITEQIKEFAIRINAYPDKTDIKWAEEEVRPKSSWERTQDRAGKITQKILDILYPDKNQLKDAAVLTNRLTAMDIHELIASTLGVLESIEKLNSPHEKSIPREGVVSNLESVIKRKPEGEEDLWKVARFLWEKYKLPDFEEIENAALERLGRITETKARRMAGEMLFTWLDDVASDRYPEQTVIGWMLERYKLNFTGKNAEYGNRFGHVYLQELERWMQTFNQSIEERRKRIEQAVNGEVVLESYETSEIEAMERVKPIDNFFVRRVIAHFKLNGIELK
ncbi:MAG: hypothetical protein WC269_03330 [Candidatus Gracilibacteria bacterium]|jgi:hypothetical protein